MRKLALVVLLSAFAGSSFAAEPPPSPQNGGQEATQYRLTERKDGSTVLELLKGEALPDGAKSLAYGVVHPQKEEVPAVMKKFQALIPKMHPGGQGAWNDFLNTAAGGNPPAPTKK